MKPFIEFVIIVALAAICIFGLAKRNERIDKLSEDVARLPDITAKAREQLANAYFHLGVARAYEVMMTEAGLGRPMPYGTNLLRDCIELEIRKNGITNLIKPFGQ